MAQKVSAIPHATPQLIEKSFAGHGGSLFPRSHFLQGDHYDPFRYKEQWILHCSSLLSLIGRRFYLKVDFPIFVKAAQNFSVHPSLSLFTLIVWAKFALNILHLHKAWDSGKYLIQPNWKEGYKECWLDFICSLCTRLLCRVGWPILKWLSKRNNLYWQAGQWITAHSSLLLEHFPSCNNKNEIWIHLRPWKMFLPHEQSLKKFCRCVVVAGGEPWGGLLVCDDELVTFSCWDCKTVASQSQHLIYSHHHISHIIYILYHFYSSLFHFKLK